MINDLTCVCEVFAAWGRGMSALQFEGAIHMEIFVLSGYHLNSE